MGQASLPSRLPSAVSINGMVQESSPSIERPKLAYNLNEAAAATGYSTSTLRIAIRRHDLIARYANTRPVILAEELRDWLESLPTEPKDGHRPLSYLEDEVPGSFPGPPERPSSGPPEHRLAPREAKAVFRTPEEVAPELGMSPSRLRDYCRISGIHTRLSKNRIMLHADDITKLVAWVRERKSASND